MSILNGLGGGLAAMARGALEDENDRLAARSLLNAAPPAVAATAPAAVPVATPETGGVAATGVPPALLPVYAAASKRTGIPVSVLIAQAKQESNFNPNAIGGAGEIGLHQILPSTARDPGFGLRGVDPAVLRDPVANINFAASYLQARAGPGADFSNPAVVNAALKSYNGGGDSRYVENVRRHMVA